MLRKFRVSKGGQTQPLSGAQRAVLGALVLSRSAVSRQQLIELLPAPKPRKGKTKPRDDNRLLISALSWCRRELGLDISSHADSAMIEPLEGHVSIDLWSFLDHMEAGKHAAAEELLEKNGDAIAPPPGLEEFAFVWEETQARFDEHRGSLRSAAREDDLRRRAIAAKRDQLLDVPASPGVGSPLPLRDARAAIELLPLPWKLVDPPRETDAIPLPDYLAALFTTDRPLAGARLILIGRPGAGKTLASRLAFLRLADRFLAAPPGEPVPALLYFDANEEENANAEFSRDAWLDRALSDAGGRGSSRPIVIVAHADRLLSDPKIDPREVFSRRLFRECDTLLCVGDHLYASRLSKEEYGRRVIQVDPLGPAEQSQCAEALFDAPTREKFEAWRDEKDDGTRETICGTPLHLAYVLEFVASDPAALERISTHWHLFDRVARMRLNREGITEADEDAHFDELAALAHHFYSAATDRPIGFSRRRLRSRLKQSDPTTVDARLHDLTHHPLLSAPEPASNEIRFESASWGWFFVASHLYSAVLSESPEEILRTFSKFVSAEVADLCESMVVEDLPTHREEILYSLRTALLGGLDGGLRPSPLRVARIQIAYLLAKLDDPDCREELLALLKPGSDAWELDPYVRVAIVYGFANGGDGAAADLQVERMTTIGRPPPEVEEEREANVHLTLSFRGADEFSPHRYRRRRGEIDAGPAVAALVRLMEDEAHRDSWRLRMFSLVELRSHPAVLSKSAMWAISRQRERLHQVLAARERDPRTQGWPELGQLRQIVDE